MRKIAFFIFSSLFIFSQANASGNANINLPAYSQATCEGYTGTWRGFMTDPSNLFADGGPWPVTVQLYYHNGYIIGTTNSNPTNNSRIWAQCNNGVLSNIFWGEKGQCGSFSQQGLLVSQNALVLQLPYENAMNGAQFLTFLQRQNSKYHLPLPSNEASYALGSVQTCH